MEVRNTSSLTNYKDKSNLYRFAADLLFVKDVVSNPQKNFFGRNVDEYVSNVFQNIPHNSIFQLILYYGIFASILYLFLLLKVFKRLYNEDNIPYFISILLYFLFLGGAITGSSIILLVFILSLKSYDKKTHPIHLLVEY